MQPMPTPRGPLSAFLIETLRCPAKPAAFPQAAHEDPDDLHLALYLCYELHYLGVQGADPGWEWEPSLLQFRKGLESEFEKELDNLVPRGPIDHKDVEAQLNEIARRQTKPSLSEYLATKATLGEFREFVVHRSLYHLKEADPHSWGIPRFSGKPKAALIEIQADEYGGGRVNWMHSNLFLKLMSSIGLDGTYGHYLDLVPAVTLATVNLMSMFGLHRRWRGALAGHLALFEMTSSQPNRLYGDGLRRLGFGDEATHFYDEHVEADSLHEAIASHDLAAGLALQEPHLAEDIIFGAECLAALDRRVAHHLLESWGDSLSSLRRPLQEDTRLPAEAGLL